MKKSEIIKILKDQTTLSIDNLLLAFESSQDIFLVKYDGVRKSSKYTIMIMGEKSRFEPIRYEGDDIQVGIRSCLGSYLPFVK